MHLYLFSVREETPLNYNSYLMLCADRTTHTSYSKVYQMLLTVKLMLMLY